MLALALVGSVVEAYPSHRYAGLHLRTHPDPAAFALVGVPAILLFWRRSHPVAVYTAAVAGVAGWAAMGQVYGASLVVVLVALYSLAVAVPGRIVLAVLGAWGALTIWLAGGLLGPWGWWGGPQLDMWPEMLAAGALGAAVAARRQWKSSESLRYAQLERAREEETRRQVDSERLRIARELHDVVAHSIAMINVQASAAAMLLPDDPAAWQRHCRPFATPARAACGNCDRSSMSYARSTANSRQCRSRTKKPSRPSPMRLRQPGSSRGCAATRNSPPLRLRRRSGHIESSRSH